MGYASSGEEIEIERGIRCGATAEIVGSQSRYARNGQGVTQKKKRVVGGGNGEGTYGEKSSAEMVENELAW